MTLLKNMLSGAAAPRGAAAPGEPGFDLNAMMSMINQMQGNNAIAAAAKKWVGNSAKKTHKKSKKKVQKNQIQNSKSEKKKYKKKWSKKCKIELVWCSVRVRWV